MVRPGEGDMERMTRRQMLGALSTVFALSLRALAQTPPAVRVYKDPTCGCCSYGSNTSARLASPQL